ncbi:MAG: cytochrome c3 family protein [Deltaproteobacteria bacterium]|nr:MAG: cytochrome c3 family protein [Deltaproteobacteria bacterium]
MVKRIIMALVGLAFLGSIVALSRVTAEEKGKDVIVLKSAKAGDVTLSHKKHTEEYKIKCTDCHHKTKEEETPKACSSCHDPKEKKDEAMILKDAFHGQCKGCHTKVNKEQGKKAPDKKCKECHVKKQ